MEDRIVVETRYPKKEKAKNVKETTLSRSLASPRTVSASLAHGLSGRSVLKSAAVALLQEREQLSLVSPATRLTWKRLTSVIHNAVQSTVDGLHGLNGPTVLSHAARVLVNVQDHVTARKLSATVNHVLVVTLTLSLAIPNLVVS